MMVGYKLIIGDGTSCHDPSVRYTLGAEVERETGLWLYPTREKAADASLTDVGRQRLLGATSYRVATCEYDADNVLPHTHGGTKICVVRLVVRCLSPAYLLSGRFGNRWDCGVTQHAGGQAPVTIVDGPLAPILLGSGYYHTTPSGHTVVHYPSAYKWRTLYHRSTRRIFVGAEWLRAHQPTGQSATSRYL